MKNCFDGVSGLYQTERLTQLSPCSFFTSTLCPSFFAMFKYLRFVDVPLLSTQPHLLHLFTRICVVLVIAFLNAINAHFGVFIICTLVIVDNVLLGRR
jgi:hypothetical protein